MPGEPEQVSLRDYMQRQLDDLRRSLDERYATQTQANQELKATTAERFTSVNEFRGQLNDQVRTFMSRTEVEQLIKTLDDKTDAQSARDSERFEEINKRLNERSGGDAAMAKMLTLGLGVATLVISIVVFLANYAFGTS
ncbi:MAG TPA: hypothetical protein VK754_00555 [Propionibacteriaceae bacterium]|nr:hypothetical protein [Propionibacteriaceae bacterium]